MAVKNPKSKIQNPKKTTVKKELKVDVYDVAGKAVGKLDLPEEMFGAPADPKLLAQSVRIYLANQRQGTSAAKTRAEVSGTTKKMYKQKGTGRARHGTDKAPIFIGGGVTFAPKPREHSLSFSKKLKRKALFGAMTAKFEKGNMVFVQGLGSIAPKTKNMYETLLNLLSSGALTEKKNMISKILLVVPKALENVVLSARNIEGLNLMPANMVNPYEVLNSSNLVIMEEAVEVMKSTFLKEELKSKIKNQKSKTEEKEVKKTERKTKRSEKNKGDAK
ncbi:MAG: 50S ribosomal protein L4 [Candidatus Gottesmanbacteria bacterium GW2011_GWA2_41_12]|uniref:Large ribosomal subunit protein uL4 n=2 Tax=Candidatus Gottesmaniibacteriota TaxID=1752720 RepID=A0A0G0UI70_9BACT|nr:MAG: 50S ribosomal protein L4 [Candidatus Gottesmanbacteria bacterium GW2011_GWC2_39_8]KKR88518.1 MAG: 50S ribosomal protein L4 [Candidatus Gottesmanbacteria bacterium GW2011_GWA2_41_12]